MNGADLVAVLEAFKLFVDGASSVVEAFKSGKISKDDAVSWLTKHAAEKAANRAAEKAEIDREFPTGTDE